MFKIRFGNKLRYDDEVQHHTAWVFRSLRNAFAHSPLDPSWVWDRQCGIEVLRVPQIIELPIKSLHGKRVVRLDYHGPAGAFRLIEHLQRLVGVEEINTTSLGALNR